MVFCAIYSWQESKSLTAIDEELYLTMSSKYIQDCQRQNKIGKKDSYEKSKYAIVYLYKCVYLYVCMES